MSPITGRAERVDSLRNREKILEVADRLLAERGTSVTLNQIATVAGVGAGTVYRHFPTKDALMATVLDQRVSQVVERCTAAVGERDPGDAFFGFLRYATDQALENRGLCVALEARGEWNEPSKPVGTCVLDLPLGELLQRAQRAGEVREDLELRDVLALLPGFVGMATSLGSAERARHLAELMWDGLRPDVKRNPADRDETRSSRDLRNETLAHSSDETERRCPVCGDIIEVAETGRPPKYCGPACRQKSFRDKRRASDTP